MTYAGVSHDPDYWLIRTCTLASQASADILNSKSPQPQMSYAVILKKIDETSKRFKANKAKIEARNPSYPYMAAFEGVSMIGNMVKTLPEQTRSLTEAQRRRYYFYCSQMLDLCLWKTEEVEATAK